MPQVNTVANEFFRRLSSVYSDRAYMRGGSVVPGAGENAVGIVKNPAGSSVDLAIFNFWIAFTGATNWAIVTNVTADQSPAPGLSMRDQTVTSSGLFDSLSSAGFPGGNLLLSSQLQADLPFQIAVDYPLVLTPGNGIAIYTTTTDVGLLMSAFWLELPRS